MTLAVERYERRAHPALARFIRSWESGESYDRFGTLGPAPAEWLIEQLAAERHRDALVVHCDGAPVAMLDYCRTVNGVDFGVFVASSFRRKRIALGMIDSLFASLAPDVAVVAQCRAENRPAVALLRRAGFRLVRTSYGGMEWALRERAAG